MRKPIWLLLPLAALLPATLMLRAPAAEPPSPSATAPIPAAPAAEPAPVTPATPSKQEAATPAASAAAPEQTAAPAPGQPSAAASPAPAAKFRREQLEQMLAPIALYPDQLLGQILMASTYPAEVVEAARWARVPAHRRLKGDALAAALKAKGWDPSVMALVPFPRVLEVMSQRLDWLRDLGTAFVAQQAEVMAAVQHLRHIAMAAGTLKTTPQCHCTVSTQGETITIATVASEPVCVPVYHSRMVYGTWLYPDYPPIDFPFLYGVAFVPGYYIGFYPPIDVAWYAPLWGWDSIDWGAGSIIVDPGRYAVLAAGYPGFSGSTWAYNPGRWGAVGAGRLGAAAGMAAALPGMRGAAAGRAAAIGGRAGYAAAMHAARGGGRWGDHAGYAYGRHGAVGHFAAHGGPHWRGGGHFAGRYWGGHYGGPHFAGGMYRGGHFGGGPHFGMGGRRGGGHFGGGGGGPHFAIGAGGGGHGGGGGHFGGGGGHGGGGGGGHGGGGHH